MLAILEAAFRIIYSLNVQRFDVPHQEREAPSFSEKPLQALIDNSVRSDEIKARDGSPAKANRRKPRASKQRHLFHNKNRRRCDHNLY